MLRIIPCGLAVGLLVAVAAPTQSAEVPPELGRVGFARDLDATLAAAPDKPVFLLFQEIPG